ncbi:MAG: PIN domain-containing protein [Actinobacteria bacterium]|nr:PIN domain-containing protein [Actinomycetota bacterium]
MRFLLDSTVLIDHLNGIDAAEAFLRAHSLDSCLSVITVNEILAGSEPAAVRGHELLLDQFACLDVDRLTAKASAALRRAHGWKLADSIQAALALNNGLKLVTRNHRDFKPAKHPFVVVPYRVVSRKE